jgi:hypothetical protein
MAIGSASSQYDGYDKYFLKIVGLKKGEEKVTFEISKKVGEDYKVVGSERQVSGIITDITTRTFTYQGEEIPKLIIYMVDPNASESIRIETGYNQLSRSLMNSLADKDLDGVNVLIRLYNEKKEGRPRVHVEIDNERADWVMSMEDIQNYVDVNEIYKGGKKVGEEVDFTRLNELMFGEVLASIKERVTKTVPKPVGKAATSYEEHAEQEPETKVVKKSATAYPTAEEVKAESERQQAAAAPAKPAFLQKPKQEPAAPSKPGFVRKPAPAVEDDPAAPGSDDLPF